METILVSTLTSLDVYTENFYHHFREDSFKRLLSSLAKKAFKEGCLIYLSDRKSSEFHDTWKEIRIFRPTFDFDGNNFFEITLHVCYIRSQI